MAQKPSGSGGPASDSLACRLFENSRAFLGAEWEASDPGLGVHSPALSEQAPSLPRELSSVGRK